MKTRKNQKKTMKMTTPKLEIIKEKARAAAVVTGGKYSLMAFGIRKNRIYSAGVNSYTKTHPVQSFYGKKVGQPNREYLHAEIAALLRAPKDIDTLLVVRINKKGEFACAKPCEICDLAIKKFNPNLKVVHT